MTAAAAAGPVQVDHLVVAADSLEQGVAWCERTLGVAPGPGGKHALMGTHNRLLRIAGPGFPDAYLEIIAIDPAAPPPGRPRWFGLDDAALQARLKQGPRLLHMVARCGRLEALRTALIDAGLRPGEVVAAQRDTPQGRLAWEILVNVDGSLDRGGALPTLIRWQGRHPADAMPESGVVLQGLALRGLPTAVGAILGLAGVELPADPGPALQARLQTPLGTILLESE